MNSGFGTNAINGGLLTANNASSPSTDAALVLNAGFAAIGRFSAGICGSLTTFNGTPRHTTRYEILCPDITNFRRPAVSVKSIPIASIHSRFTSSSCTGLNTASTNTRHEIDSEVGIGNATMFSFGTPRFSA